MLSVLHSSLVSFGKGIAQLAKWPARRCVAPTAKRDRQYGRGFLGPRKWRRNWM